ncbi:hypothetical protein [Aeromicrobium sp.]|uniref:hypothetical protein n=1 Tax=Aeromicrobium sp. TaxID=1871063 RepID=UPI0019C47822|nr:hypothetical protein [Aeromicrobium sp.]MBC7632143.1 hypothetical protein [Aeromicrobium sp.]
MALGTSRTKSTTEAILGLHPGIAPDDSRFAEGNLIITDLNLSGTTVTLFGESDPLDVALVDELGRRGCSTHSVTVPSGWLASSTHAIIRLDTPAGRSAFDGLINGAGASSRVVAVCEVPPDADSSARTSDECRRCGATHDVSLIWHPALQVTLSDVTAPMPPELVPPAHDLASTIADRLALRARSPRRPAFASQTFYPETGSTLR